MASFSVWNHWACLAVLNIGSLPSSTAWFLCVPGDRLSYQNSGSVINKGIPGDILECLVSGLGTSWCVHKKPHNKRPWLPDQGPPSFPPTSTVPRTRARVSSRYTPTNIYYSRGSLILRVLIFPSGRRWTPVLRISKLLSVAAAISVHRPSFPFKAPCYAAQHQPWLPMRRLQGTL